MLTRLICKLIVLIRVGIAGDVLKKISDSKVNLRDLRVETNTAKHTATISVIIDVVDISQLTKISQSISKISDVLRVRRRDFRPKDSAGKTASNVTPLPPRKRNTETDKNNDTPEREIKSE